MLANLTKLDTSIHRQPLRAPQSARVIVLNINVTVYLLGSINKGACGTDVSLLLGVLTTELGKELSVFMARSVDTCACEGLLHGLVVTNKVRSVCCDAFKRLLPSLRKLRCARVSGSDGLVVELRASFCGEVATVLNVQGALVRILRRLCWGSVPFAEVMLSSGGELKRQIVGEHLAVAARRLGRLTPGGVAKIHKVRLLSCPSFERPVLLHELLFMGSGCRSEFSPELVLRLGPKVAGVPPLHNIRGAFVCAASATCADAIGLVLVCIGAREVRGVVG